FFWHDDFSGIDWQQRLKSDAQTEFAFLDRTLGEKVNDSSRMEMENFSKKINAYPSDKVQFLKNVAQSYLLYSTSMINCIDNYVDTMLKSDERIKFNWDEPTMAWADTIKTKYGNYNIAADNQFIDSAINALDSG